MTQGIIDYILGGDPHHHVDPLNDAIWGSCAALVEVCALSAFFSFNILTETSRMQLKTFNYMKQFSESCLNIHASSIGQQLG